MSNNYTNAATFRVAFHDGLEVSVFEVKGTDYEVSDGILHIVGDGEVAVFASGAWVYAHGVPADTKEN